MLEVFQGIPTSAYLVAAVIVLAIAIFIAWRRPACFFCGSTNITKHKQSNRELNPHGVTVLHCQACGCMSRNS